MSRATEFLGLWQPGQGGNSLFDIVQASPQKSLWKPTPT